MNREEKKKEKPALARRILDSLDIPVGAVGKISFVEAVGNREISVDGCVGLNEYGQQKIVLTLCDGKIIINGSGLELHSFSGGRVSVDGTIRSIEWGGDGADAN